MRRRDLAVFRRAAGVIFFAATSRKRSISWSSLRPKSSKVATLILTPKKQIPQPAAAAPYASERVRDDSGFFATPILAPKSRPL
jgi:hypothetical protein